MRIQMTARIEVATTVFDTRADKRKKSLSEFPFAKKINKVSLLDVYTIDKSFSEKELNIIGSRIANPVTQSFVVKQKGKKNMQGKNDFHFAIEIGLLPGVTDNV